MSQCDEKPNSICFSINWACYKAKRFEFLRQIKAQRWVTNRNFLPLDTKDPWCLPFEITWVTQFLFASLLFSFLAASETASASLQLNKGVQGLLLRCVIVSMTVREEAGREEQKAFSAPLTPLFSSVHPLKNLQCYRLKLKPELVFCCLMHLKVFCSKGQLFPSAFSSSIPPQLSFQPYLRFSMSGYIGGKVISAFCNVRKL